MYDPFYNFPEYWQFDLVFISLTVIGVIAIILNLSAVLAFIYGILYSIIAHSLSIATIIAAVYLTFRFAIGRRR